MPMLTAHGLLTQSLHPSPQPKTITTFIRNPYLGRTQDGRMRQKGFPGGPSRVSLAGVQWFPSSPWKVSKANELVAISATSSPPTLSFQGLLGPSADVCQQRLGSSQQLSRLCWVTLDSHINWDACKLSPLAELTRKVGHRLFPT